MNAAPAARARDGSRWTRSTPRSESKPYTKPARVDLVLLLCMALVARSVSLTARFRGHPPVYMGRRAQARSQGYANHRAMVAEQNLKRLNEQARADSEA